MNEKATIYNFARMCKAYIDCKGCPLKEHQPFVCNEMIRKYPDKANEIILNWCEEHPIKTRQSRFLEMFPNAKITNGVVTICPKNVETTLKCSMKSCEKCSEEYWLAEV